MSERSMPRWSDKKVFWMNILGRVIAAGLVGGCYYLIRWIEQNWLLFLGFLERGGGG